MVFRNSEKSLFQSELCSRKHNSLSRNMAMQNFKSKRKGHLYIVCPTLEMLLSSCGNVKNAAGITDMEYSNFVKKCKLQQDIRIGTYQRCASGFNQDTLIIHLPTGLIESIASPKQHLSNRFYTIRQEEFIMVLQEYFLKGKRSQTACLETIFTRLMKQEPTSMGDFLLSVMKLCENMLKEYGKK